MIKCNNCGFEYSESQVTHLRISPIDGDDCLNCRQSIKGLSDARLLDVLKTRLALK